LQSEDIDIKAKVAEDASLDELLEWIRGKLRNLKVVREPLGRKARAA
jgi:hypothetical protein